MAAVAGTVAEALLAATDALRAAGVDSPRLDAEVLLAAATRRDRAALAASPESGVDAVAARSFGAAVRRRVMREPVAYILGSRGFRYLEIRCDRRALIPRPETELLVEVASELGPASVLDVGTGTGAIALAVAHELPGCDVVAVDTSPEALALAGENVAALGLEERVTLEYGPTPSSPREFDLVVANLPYVPDGDWATLQPEITKYEPREALVGGPDGLDVVRDLLGRLASGALSAPAVALEIGKGQGEATAELVRAAGYPQAEVRVDLAGIDRVVVGRRAVS